MSTKQPLLRHLPEFVVDLSHWLHMNTQLFLRIKTEEHGNADALSRLPLQVVSAKIETPPEIVLLMEILEICVAPGLVT